MPVLFTNYLRGDPSVQDWAGQVITAALADAETEAYACHARVLAAPTKTAEHVAAELELTATTANELLGGKLDTAFAACADINHSPLNQGRCCTASFMMCFGGPNALVTHDHIPKLKALLDWLIDQRNKIDLDLWWRQYGLTWLAITKTHQAQIHPGGMGSGRTSRRPTRTAGAAGRPQEPR
jgi:hypothetical protein